MPKAFAFRLEKLLELRRVREDAARRELALARKAVADQNRVIAGLLRDEDEGKRAMRPLREKSIDVVQVRLHEGFLAGLERRIRREVARRQELATVETQKRIALVEARKGVRVLERFREKQRLIHVKEIDAEERKFLDEVAQRTAAE